MLNPLIVKWLNGELIGELEEIVARIPKDLKTWKGLVKKLKHSKIRRERKQSEEYGRLYIYYLGKMMAYIFILTRLGDSKFVSQWEKKFKVKYAKMDNRKNGGIRIIGRW